MRVKAFFGGVIALVIGLNSLTPALAAPSKSMFRTNGVSVYGSWDSVVDTTETYDFILVDNSNQGMFVGYQHCTFDTVTFDGGCQSGFATPSANVFSVNKKINSATLTNVSVDLYDDYGNFVGTTSVSGNWTGVGSTTRVRDNIVSKYGTFSEHYRDSAQVRYANVSLSVGAQDLGPSIDGGMASYKTADITMSK